MPTAEVNSVELYYVEAGAGVPCIALHGGLGYDHSYLRSTFGPLEDVCRFVYLDQRGNGRSGRPPLQTISISQLARDVDGLRGHLGLDRVALLGHSYGGFVALEYATRFPARVTHLVAVDTSPGAFEPTQEELAERAEPSWMTAAVRAAAERLSRGLPTTDEEFEQMLPVIAPVYLKDLPAEPLVRLLADTVLDARTATHSMAALQGWSVADELGRITAPTLVLCGRYDLMTTPECSRRLATAIPGAELVFFENSGHFPWLEEPDAFFGVVRSFFARRS